MNVIPKALERNPVKALLSNDAIKARFHEVLGAKAPQFMASVANVGMQLHDVEPMSVVAAAFVAASLDLPIDKNLGFAHIVPYATSDHEGQRQKVAQFQVGYKGFIQLALRSGQYLRMNAQPINTEAFGGYDEVGEPQIRWEEVDWTKPPVGYAFAWKLITGFTKTIYWPKTRIEAHAKKYSQAFRSQKKDTPWISSPDQMALKTVVKFALSHWGILSVPMQQAIMHDQASQRGIDEPVEYIDGAAEAEGQPEQERAIESKLTGFTKELKKKPGRPRKEPAIPSAPAETEKEFEDLKHNLLNSIQGTEKEFKFAKEVIKATTIDQLRDLEITIKE